MIDEERVERLDNAISIAVFHAIRQVSYTAEFSHLPASDIHKILNDTDNIDTHEIATEIIKKAG